MGSREKVDMLRAFLASRPANPAGSIGRSFAMDRIDHADPSGEPVMESLPSSLRYPDRPQRANTPMRIFCLPFEDLLTNEPRQRKQKGRILRSSITPVWNWLGQQLMPDTLNAFSLRVKTAAMGLRDSALEADAAAVWKAAADILRAKLANESGGKSARQALGSESIIEDAREMALLLSAGPEICELQDRLPQSAASLNAEITRTFRDIEERLSQRVPDAVAYLQLVVMRRLEQPWEALRLAENTAESTSSDSSRNPGTGLVADILFSTIESHAADILSTSPARFSADVLLRHLERFMTLANGAVKEIELRRDGVWGQRLLKEAAAVTELMRGFLEQAPAEIETALPLHDGLSTCPDPDKFDRALSYARLVSGCRLLASPGSFALVVKETEERIAEHLRTYNENIAASLRDGVHGTRADAEQYAALAAELTSILFPEGEREPPIASHPEAMAMASD